MHMNIREEHLDNTKEQNNEENKVEETDNEREQE